MIPKHENKDSSLSKRTTNLLPIEVETTENSDEYENMFKIRCEQDPLKEKIFHYIGSFSQAPNFLQDNNYIHHGYRINFNSARSILKSLFILHNEFVNIWTHLLGVLFVLFLVFYLAITLQGSLYLKEKIQEDMNKVFKPIYSEIKNLETSFNYRVENQFEQIKSEMSQLNNKFSGFISELDKLKQDMNKENFKLFVNKIEEIPNFLRTTVNDLSSPVSTETLKSYTSTLKTKVDEISSSIVQKIDSEEFDWIDIYTYYKQKNKNYQSTPLRNYRDPHHISRWPIFVFLASAMLCLGFSSIFHLFFTMSESTNKLLLKLDYAGINLLISGSPFPPLVYGFYCQFHFAILYVVLNVTASVIVFFVSLTEKIHTEAYRKIKGGMYGCLGIFAGTPVIHLLVNTYHKTSENDFLDFSKSVPLYLLMGGCYLGGLAIYLARCPERFRPGTFDIWGHSHQLWHCCVLAAIFLTYFAALEDFYARKETVCILEE